MADTLVNKLSLSSDISVPASSKIGVWSLGSFQVYQLNSANIWVLVKDQPASQDQYTSAAVSAASTFRVQATGQQDVWVSVGTDPIVRSGGRLIAPYGVLGTPGAFNTSATATTAQLLSGALQSTTAAAVALTTPTGTQIDAATTMAIGDSFELTLINTGGTNALSITAGSGVTLIGAASITSGGMTVRFVKTAANTFSCYRI